MSERIPVSVLIMTKNEEMNIRACLESVKWADEIIVVDSQSSDRTLKIVKEYTDKIYQYAWNGKNPKKNWSLEAPKFFHDWILMIDADERATIGFKAEIEKIVSDSANQYAGYLVRYHYRFLNKYIKFGDPVRKLIFFRKSRSRFESYDISGADTIKDLEVGHEHPVIDGAIGCARSPILHEDNRPLYYYFDRHNRYSTWEAYLIYKDRYGKNTPAKVEPKMLGSWLNARRLMKQAFLYLPFKPIVYFIYSYFFRLGFLDGYPGLCYNICKSVYAYQIGLKLRELKTSLKKSKG